MEAIDMNGSYLENNGVELYIGEYKNGAYQYKRLYDSFNKQDINYKLTTKIDKGKELIASDIKIHISHTELMNYGFHITGGDKDTPRYTIKDSFQGKPLKELRNIKILMDVRNKVVWLEGSNVNPKEVSLLSNRGRPKKEGMRLYSMFDDDGNILMPDYNLMKSESDRVIDKWNFGFSDVKNEFVIENDVAFLVTIDGEIACYNGSLSQMPKILIIGDSGSGKSQTMCRLIVQFYYKIPDINYILVDPLNQFHKMYEGMEYKPFVRILNLVGEEPIGIPLNYFYLASKDLPKVTESHCFTYAVDFFEFINKYGYFTYGVEEWDLGGTTRYIKDIAVDLVKCKTKKEVEDVVHTKFPPKEGKQYQDMVRKWTDSIDGVFTYKFTSNFYKAVKWKVVKPGFEYEGDPLIASMFSGIFTVLGVNYAKHIPSSNSACSRNILANVFEKIINFKRVNDYAMKQKVFLIIDELNNIFTGRKNDNLNRVTIEAFTQGRFQQIGFIGTKQGFDDLPEQLIQNSTSMIVGKVGSATYRRLIGKKFNLTNEQIQQLEKLKPSKREVIAINEDPFVIYDNLGRKTFKNFVRGYYIPANCNTLKSAA